MDPMPSRAGWVFVKIFPGCPPEERPVVLGEDLAGEVVAVGSGVTAFNVGDKV